MKNILLLLFVTVTFLYCNESKVNGSIKNSLDTDKKIDNVTTKSSSIDTIKIKIKILDTIISKNKSVSKLWFEKAKLFLLLKEKDSAVKYLQKTIKSSDNNIEAIVNLAYIYSEEGNINCVKLCEKLLRSKNKSIYPKANYILGVYYSIVKDYARANKYFDRCIALDWTFIEAYLEKGVYYFENKEYKESLKIFTLANKVNNRNAEVYYWIGRVWEVEGNFINAKKYYKHSLLLDPGLSAALNRLRQLQN